MPKSYELKLREAEERRRPRPKEELYKAIEGQPQKMMLGFDHPETLQLEMQITWVEDTFTIEQTHDHLMAEVRRLDGEYRRKPLRCNYTKKYLWFDRFVLRPYLKGRELLLQDYAIEPGYRVKVNPFYGSERMWGQPWPFEPHKERPAEQSEPCEDQALLRRLDKGPPTLKNRIFFFPWMGGSSSAYIPVAAKMPKDVACFALEMPGRGEREMDEGYPTAVFAVEVIARTLVKEMKKPGHNFFFGHSQGTSFAYYAAKLLMRQFNVSITCFFVSNFSVPAAFPTVCIDTLQDRQNVCVPLRIFVGLIKSGWGTDPKLGYKSHMGPCAYQFHDVWPTARKVLSDYWLVKEFPLPSADVALPCPIVAFYGQDDHAVSLDMVKEWKNLTTVPSQFEVVKMEGDHLWFATSTARCESLATELSSRIASFQ